MIGGLKNQVAILSDSISVTASLWIVYIHTTYHSSVSLISDERGAIRDF